MSEQSTAIRRQAGFTLIELMVVVAIIGVVSALMMGLSSRTYGANSRLVSDQIASTLNAARMRAIATRRLHRVYITPNDVQVWANVTNTGLVDTNLTDVDAFVERVRIQHGIKILEVKTSIDTATGNSATENPSLQHILTYKPDGTSSGGTLYIKDTLDSKYRVLVYKATGSVYARQTW